MAYAEISPEIRQYLGYLDAAARQGHQGAVNEILRIYREGLLVSYNKDMVDRIQHIW